MAGQTFGLGAAAIGPLLKYLLMLLFVCSTFSLSSSRLRFADVETQSIEI